MNNSQRVKWVVVLILGILILDQVLKFYVKTNFELGGGFSILGLDWAQIKFTENYGMAFGMEFGGTIGKIILSIFRVLAGGVLMYYTIKTARNVSKNSIVFSLGLITAGAIGNVIDGLLYGILFSESTPSKTAQFLGPEGGYSSIFEGHVVDMLYFPIIDTTWPEWLPFIGGEGFAFNRYIFNLADLYITVGVIAIIIIGFRSKKNPFS